MMRSMPNPTSFRHGPSVLAVALSLACTLLPPEPVAAQTGTIEGRVQLPTAAPRRTASRYAGAAPAARTVQEIPAIAYISGAVAGSRVPAPPSPALAQQDTAFVPNVLVVPVGTTVEFPNRDPFFHNVFSYSSAQRFDLGRYPRGESKSVEFAQAGVVKVYCEVHESMRAALVVVENPFHAVIGADGTFRIANVPAGRHTVVVWHHDGGMREVAVDVRPGAVAPVRLRF